MENKKTIKILDVELIFQDNKLVPQPLPKSLMAALYQKTLVSFRSEINLLMSSFQNIEFENQIHDYLILQQCLNKKNYSKSVCNIIFKYLTDISYQEVDNNHKKIKEIYLKNVRNKKK